jgi:beta-glucanase (GH16 family)
MMKNLFLFLFVLFLTSASAQTPQWRLVWSDEFNDTTINARNWTFDTGTGEKGWGNEELEYYTTRYANSLIENGKLLIIGRKENYMGCKYTSARLKTKGLNCWTYGKIEARMKLPTGQGMWPAFWMLGNNIDSADYPWCGEIDIMEKINSDPKVYGTMHWYADEGTADWGGKQRHLKNPNGYHTYSIEWDSMQIRWLVDTTEYWKGDIWDTAHDHTQAFHKPFFIILNLAIGGDWPQSPDSTTVFPDTMFVDYVRVYQKTEKQKNK